MLGKRSRFLLENARFVTLATSGPAGIWASTVNYVVLPNPLRLLWYSLKTARHSLNIAAQPYISGSLFLTGLTGSNAPSGIPIDGAQLTGTCHEVSGPEATEHHREYYERNFPDPAIREQWLLPLSDFRDEGPRRFYSLRVNDWWLYDADRWLVDKHDTRVEVPLSTIHI
ncbi:MAG: pyridoxamine 5'-phosphate oxidase family protein [Corynebacteriales bacterium]|nr:pyridoxamine 5'-phosphate oxidase family protein [Mycobacteriales bacterium]